MIKGKRWTVINTDAGIKGSISAFAFWIKSDNAKHVHSAVFKKSYTSSTEAEVAAIINALHFVNNDEHLRSADFLHINCDNKGAIKMIKAGDLSNYPDLHKAFHKLKKSIGKPIRVKWVKGHSEGRTSREYINNFIDAEIRKHYKSTTTDDRN